MSEVRHDDTPADPLSPYFERFARTVLRHRLLFAVLTLASSGALAYAAVVKHRVDTSAEAFLAHESPAMNVLRDMRADFGRDEMFFVMVEGDVFTLPFLEKLKKLHDELARLDVPIETLGRDRGAPPAPAPAARAKPSLDGFDDLQPAGAPDDGWGEEKGGTVVDEIISLINTRQTRWKGGALDVAGLLDEWPSEAELPGLKKFVLSERSLVGRVIGSEGRHTAIIIRTAFMSEKESNKVYDAIVAAAAKYEAQGFHVHVAGMPALAAALNRMMLADLARMGQIAILVMVLLMAWIFRHPLGVLGPVAVVVQACVWTFGVMALTDTPMTMVTNILPAFIICVAIGDSIHIQSVYRDARLAGRANHDAIVYAVGSAGIPCLFTTLTTCMGLWSFKFTSLEAIQAMGIYGGLGVLVALMHTLVTVPLVLSFNTTSLLGATHSARRRDLLDRVIELSSRASCTPRGRRTVLVVSSLIAVVSVLGALRLAVYHNPLTWVPTRYPIRQAFDSMDAHVGGNADVALLIDTKPGKTIKDRELMLALAELDDYVRKYRNERVGQVVGNVVSVLDVVRESSRAIHEMDPRHYAVPDTERGVADMITLFENSGPAQLRRMATVDLSRALITVRVKWLDASSYTPFARYLERGIERYVGDLAQVQLTGSVYNLITTVHALLRDLIQSFGSALLLISALMVLLVRNWKLGLISMLPNLLPIALTLGMMGFAGIPVDMNNTLISSVAIGIAVDDTIHFCHHWFHHYKHHGDVDAAVSHTFSQAGRAMIMTSMILVLGFSVFMSAEMYNLQRFGLLVGVTVFFALVVDLIFTPALLRAFYPKKPAARASVQGVEDDKSAVAAE